MNKKLHILGLLIVMILVSACSNFSEASSEDEVKVMRIANATPDDRSLSKAFYRFEEIVEQETNGNIEVEVFTNSILGGDREIFEGMQLNTIQGASISTGPIAQFSSNFNVFDLPFLFPDEQSAYEVLDGPIGQEILNELPEQNVVGLNYWENGYRQLTNNKREIKTVKDIQGLDIRTLENELHMDLWKQFGANPTPISYGELYVTLEQGTVNGQENPVGNVVNSNFYEVQHYLTKTNHIYNASPFMVSKPFWDSLTEEEQNIVKNAADEVRDYQRDANRQESEESYKLLEKRGMEVTELSEEEQEKFREKAESVYESYKEKYDKEVIDKVLEAVEKTE